jgi:hypothetical protein
MRSRLTESTGGTRAIHSGRQALDDVADCDFVEAIEPES